jgi:hypothetical protein
VRGLRRLIEFRNDSAQSKWQEIDRDSLSHVLEQTNPKVEEERAARLDAGAVFYSTVSLCRMRVATLPRVAADEDCAGAWSSSGEMNPSRDEDHRAAG